MKRYSSVIVWLGIVAVMFVLFAVLPNFLDSDEPLRRDDTYTVQNYEVRYEHESGRTFSVTETITAVFNEYGKHGIIRDLPYNSGEVYGDISSDDVFDVEMSGDFVSVYLGDANATAPVGEPVTYTLEYTFKLPSSAGRDTIYINLIGGGWTTDIENAVCTLVLPEEPTGSVLVNTDDFTGNHSLDGKTLTVTASGLSPFTPVTVQCTMPSGTLGGMSPDGGEIAALLVAIAFLAAAVILAILFPKHDFTPVVNFTPPNGVNPLLVGAMIDGSVQNGDITSLIYYWAHNKKLTIDLTKEDDPVLHKIGELEADAPEYERVVFERIFAKDETVAVSSLSNTFYSAASKAKKLAEKQCPKMFSKNSTLLAAAVLIASALFCFLTVLLRGLHISSSVTAIGGILAAIPLAAIFALGYWSLKNSLRVSKRTRTGILIGQIAIAAVFTAAVFLLVPQTLVLDALKPFLCLLAAGTAIAAPYSLRFRKEYVEAMNPMLGFREFIRLAEKDRLEMMLAEDPEYYYNILPYAQVLGVSDIWEEKFKDIKMDPPAWAIAPNNTLFDFMVFNAAMRTATRSMATAFVSRPASSGRSGGGRFGGGGGFHGGGGFGGGGGRSW